MTRPIGLVLVLVLALLALAGCRSAPVRNVDQALLMAPLDVTLEEVTTGIVRVGALRDWRMTEIAPGHLVAEIEVRGRHRAAADIFFDTRVFSIQYRYSENLNFDARRGLIHPNYNQWVMSLRSGIQREMRAIGRGGSPARAGNDSGMVQQPGVRVRRKKPDWIWTARISNKGGKT